MIKSVVLDVGETLLDDTREFAAWADWIGVPRHTFSAVLGAVTAAGRDNVETFQFFRRDFVPRPDMWSPALVRLVASNNSALRIRVETQHDFNAIQPDAAVHRQYRARPVTASTSTSASEYRSERASSCTPRACSGDA